MKIVGGQPTILCDAFDIRGSFTFVHGNFIVNIVVVIQLGTRRFFFLKAHNVCAQRYNVLTNDSRQNRIVFSIYYYYFFFMSVMYSMQYSTLNSKNCQDQNRRLYEFSTLEIHEFLGGRRIECDFVRISPMFVQISTNFCLLRVEQR